MSKDTASNSCFLTDTETSFEDNGKDDSSTSSLDLYTERSVHLNDLPSEILEFIFSYLPPYQDLESCNAVCKRWNMIVKNFIRRAKMNLNSGLLDFRLCWEMLPTPSTTAAAAIPTSNQQQLNAVGSNCALPGSSSSSSSLSSSSLSSISTSSVQPTITGRFSHSAVRYGNSMYVFGGGSSTDTTFNDLWRFDLSSMRWERPLSMGSYPSPKGSASMVCWREYLVLFGGWRYPSLHPPYQPWRLFDELHYYDINSNRWTIRITLTSPPPMAGHSASVHGDRMVIFGGYQIIDGVNSNSNDLWCLNLEENSWWQPRLLSNTKPPPRYGQFQMEIDEKHLLIVGGCGGPNCVYSDAWLLDMSKDVWSWHPVQVRNKKFAASHMWCNPACKVDSKLVVLGSTPNMPQDFQMMKQTRVPVGRVMNAAQVGALQQNLNNLRNGPHGIGGRNEGGGPMALRPHPNQYNGDNVRFDAAANANEHYFANRRAILNQHLISMSNNSNANNNLQPRVGRLSELRASVSSPAMSNSGGGNDSGVGSNANVSARATDEHNQNRPSCSNSAPPAIRPNGAARNDNEPGGSGPNGVSGQNAIELEAAIRLQRNLALRCRDNNPFLPKRFNELHEDPFRMAAFNVQSRPRSMSRDHNERIRRLEEKMNALRNAIRGAAVKAITEPSPKRIKRNVISLFVCDLSMVLDTNEPHIEWLEYKNYGVLPGAPERLILSTMVAGNGELILFGGVHKETLNEITHQVSNTIHFLCAPRDIV